MTGIVVALAAGAFIGATDKNGWFGGHVNTAYYILTAAVFVMSMFASVLVHQDGFQNPKRAPFLLLNLTEWGLNAGIGISQRSGSGLYHNSTCKSGC